MAKNLGLSEKFADLSQQFSPEELFKHLKFVAMTQDTEQKPKPKPKELGDNQPIVPITPVASKFDIPGLTVLGTSKQGDNFSLSAKISARDLLKPIKK